MSTLHFNGPVWNALQSGDRTVVFGPQPHEDDALTAAVNTAITAIKTLNDAIQGTSDWEIVVDKDTREKIVAHRVEDVVLPPLNPLASKKPMRGRKPRMGTGEVNLLDLCCSEGFINDGRRMLMSHQWDNMVRFYYESTLDMEGARADARAAKPGILKNTCVDALKSVEIEARTCRKDSFVSYSGLPPYGLILADVPGLGKTTTGLMCGVLSRAVSRAQEGPTRILAVVPLSVTAQWTAEVETMFGWKGQHVVVYEPTKTTQTELENANIVIVPESSLSTMLKSIWTKPKSAKAFHRSGDPERAGWKRVNQDQDVKHPLFHSEWAALIVDESHNYRNPATQGSVAIAALGAASRVRVLLTGTPYVNRMDDYTVQMKLVGGRPELHDGPQSKNPGIQQQFTERAQRTSLVGHPKSILKLPLLREVLVEVPMSPKDIEAVREAAVAVTTGVNDTFKSINHLLYASSARPLYEYRDLEHWQLTNVNNKYTVNKAAESDGHKATEGEERMLRDFKASKIAEDPSLKLQIAVNIALQAKYSGRKTVMFAHSIPILQAMESLINESLGSGSAALYTGEVSQHTRHTLVNPESVKGSLFKQGENPWVLLCSIKAGGFGLNLAPAASVCVILDCGWTPSEDRQAIDRIHRVGATTQCDAYILANQLSSEDLIRRLYHQFKEDNYRRIMEVSYVNNAEVQEKPNEKLMAKVAQAIEDGFAEVDPGRAYEGTTPADEEYDEDQIEEDLLQARLKEAEELQQQLQRENDEAARIQAELDKAARIQAEIDEEIEARRKIDELHRIAVAREAELQAHLAKSRKRMLESDRNLEILRRQSDEAAARSKRLRANLHNAN